MQMKKCFLSILPAIAFLACSEANVEAAESHQEVAQAVKQEDKKEVAVQPNIKSEELGGGFYMLTGPGGNIGVSTGDDGVFVIDDKFARFGEEIIETIKTLSDQPIRFVVNTHYHGDHTGGNTHLKATGATVVAHENVRTRMGLTFENKLFGRTINAVEPEQWPDLTFSENATFYMNGEEAQVIHTPNAHTDGDAIIYFVEANILHMGDNFFNGLFPYIDVDSGGSLQGMIAAHQVALDLINDDTRVIPGHGPLATKNDLKTAQSVLITVQSRVKSQIDEGKNLDMIIASAPLADMSKYSAFIDEDNMVRIAYASLANND